MSTTQPFSVWLAEDDENNASTYHATDAEAAARRHVFSQSGPTGLNGSVLCVRARDGRLSRFRVTAEWDLLVSMREQDVEPHEHGRDDVADEWMDARDERRRMGDG